MFGIDPVNLISLVLDKIDEIDIKTTLFDYQGNRIEGSESIKLTKGKPTNRVEAMWWFKVEPIEGYAFIRLPINPSGVEEQIGTWEGEAPDANWFRYIHPSHIAKDFAPNVNTQFLIIGYPYKSLFKIKNKNPVS